MLPSHYLVTAPVLQAQMRAGFIDEKEELLCCIDNATRTIDWAGVASVLRVSGTKDYQVIFNWVDSVKGDYHEKSTYYFYEFIAAIAKENGGKNPILANQLKSLFEQGKLKAHKPSASPVYHPYFYSVSELCSGSKVTYKIVDRAILPSERTSGKDLDENRFKIGSIKLHSELLPYCVCVNDASEQEKNTLEEPAKEPVKEEQAKEFAMPCGTLISLTQAQDPATWYSFLRPNIQSKDWAILAAKFMNKTEVDAIGIECSSTAGDYNKKHAGKRDEVCRRLCFCGTQTQQGVNFIIETLVKFKEHKVDSKDVRSLRGIIIALIKMEYIRDLLNEKREAGSSLSGACDPSIYP